jgi:hypothetical protein
MGNESDEQELWELLAETQAPSDGPDVTEALRRARVRARNSMVDYDEDSEPDDNGPAAPGYSQWTTSDDQIFVPAGSTRVVLPSGVYEICQSNTLGTYFEKVTVKTTDLVRFPDSNSDRVIKEIRLFWESKEKFLRFKMPYKRGICLWGPPGSGKSCTVQFVMQDVVDRKGVVLKFSHPDLFLRGYRIVREIQKETPIVVIMEDIDAILEDWNESSVLNILDGAVDEVENVIFLATTNYPEKLGARVINRPSRFDRRFKIGFPTEEARQLYFEHLFKSYDLEKSEIDVDKWVADTNEMSIAHLRELFVAVIILGNEYDEAVAILKSMDANISSDQDGNGGGLGFPGS